MYKVMSSAGFSNYPLEWWHWSFGENMDAKSKGKKYAIYGGVKLTPEDIAFNRSRTHNYQRIKARHERGKRKDKVSKALFVDFPEIDPTKI